MDPSLIIIGWMLLTAALVWGINIVLISRKKNKNGKKDD